MPASSSNAALSQPLAENSSEAADTVQQSAKGGNKKNAEGGSKPELVLVQPDFRPPRTEPLLRQTEPFEDEEAQAMVQKCREFYNSGAGSVTGDGAGMHGVPALLAPYLESEHLRTDYPLWIAPEPDKIPDSLFCPVTDLLSGAVEEMAPEEGQARILKDSLSAIEETVRQQVKTTSRPVDFDPVLNQAFESAKELFALEGEDRIQFETDLNGLRNKIPAGGQLLPLTEFTPFQLLSATLKGLHRKKLESFTNEVNRLRQYLRELLRVERSKLPQMRESKHLQSSLGQGVRYIDTTSLSGVLPEPANITMSEERRKRIEKTLSVLETYESEILERQALLLIQETWHRHPGISWKDQFPDTSIRGVSQEKGGLEAKQQMEALLSEMAGFFAEMRIGRLEAADEYHPESHDAFFRYFDWKRLTEEELALAPPVIFIADETFIAGDGGASLAELLRSAKPLKILVLKQSGPVLTEAEQNPRERPEILDDEVFGFRPEPAHQAVSQRRAFVLQSTPARLEHFITGLVDGLQAPLPAFFHVLSPQTEKMSGIDPFLWAGAAVESREFPLFSYNPNLGEEWGSRFSVEKNPNADMDWSNRQLQAVDESEEEKPLELAFTPADFAALHGAWLNHFMMLPAELDAHDEFLPLAEYLRLDPDEAFDKLPYVWLVIEDNVLQRALVSLTLVQSCRERLDFWRLVQEMGGTNSFHAKQAAEESRRQAQEEMEATISTLREEHSQELEQARRETAANAMEQLASMLLDMDYSGMPVSVPPPGELPPPTLPPEVPETPEEIAEVIEEEEEEVSFDEPWIETLRCTTCNECLEINPLVFQYNADKQAFLADVSAGTFKEMVQAAECCPAKCIHPGKPLNQDEPGLDGLVERAAKFN